MARLNLEDGSVTDPNIEVGTSPAGVAVGEGSVWVTNAGDGTVSRIDPETGDVTEEIPVGTAPSGIAFGDGALWVADSIGAELLRVDPTSRASPDRCRSPASPPAWPSRRTVCGSRSPRPGSRASTCRSPT